MLYIFNIFDILKISCYCLLHQLAAENKEVNAFSLWEAIVEAEVNEEMGTPQK